MSDKTTSLAKPARLPGVGLGSGLGLVAIYLVIAYHRRVPVAILPDNSQSA